MRALTEGLLAANCEELWSRVENNKVEVHTMFLKP